LKLIHLTICYIRTVICLLDSYFVLFIVLDSENGEPITNEELKYGMKVAVIALEDSPLMKTKKALKVVGPRAFGYEFDYIPLCKAHK